jgi:hypothetical protein
MNTYIWFYNLEINFILGLAFLNWSLFILYEGISCITTLKS